MVCCNPSIRIDKVILVVLNIVLETLTSNTIVSTPHVAPNFCPRPDPLYDERHQCSGIPTWNWQQEAFLGCRIIISKKSTVQVLFSLGCIFFWKINSRLSQLYVRGHQFEQDYLQNVARLCPYNIGSSQLWNARSRFTIHAGRLPLTLPLTFQHSGTTDR